MTDARIAELEAENAHLTARLTEMQAAATAALENSRRRRVARFFEVAGQRIEPRPCVPDDATVRFRLRLIAEEFVELIECCLDKPRGDHDAWATWNELGGIAHYIDVAPVIVDLPEFARELEDLDFVTEGARIAFGIIGEPLAAAVAFANEQKRGGLVVNGKLLKPEGWQPPDIAGLLRAQGWQGEAK